MLRSQCYIIAGGMGSGKTSLLEALSCAAGYGYIPEIADKIIEEQLAINGEMLPWKSRNGFYTFQQELLMRRIQAFAAAPSDGICFSDRSIPDAIPFVHMTNASIPEDIVAASQAYRYNARVFVLPPWKEIYQNTRVRPQSFKQAETLWRLTCDTYIQCGYEVVEVPKLPVADRVRFVLAHL